MTLEHDFKQFPELKNSQMADFYFQSPHKQITEDFEAYVAWVIDGDTVRLGCDFRDFTFPLRLINVAAPEMEEKGGLESKKWLEQVIGGKKIDVKINPKIRTSDWNRLLGRIEFEGVDVGSMSVLLGHSVPWKERNEWA